MRRAGFFMFTALQRLRHTIVVDYLLAVITTVAAGGVAWTLSKALHLPNASLVFLLAVLLVAVRSSLGPALFCAVLSFLAYDWLFVSPTFSLAVHHTSDILTLLFFLVMAVLTGNLAARQRQQLKALQVLQSETAALLALSRRLGTLNERSAMLEAAQQHFSLWRDLEFCLIGRNEQGALQVETGAPTALNDYETRVAEQAWQGEPPNQSVFRPRGWWWLPLRQQRHTSVIRRARAQWRGYSSRAASVTGYVGATAHASPHPRTLGF